MEYNKRSFHDDATAIYNLPNDLPEHSRLDEQARHVSYIMNHQILHSPMRETKGKRLLDIGCGTGYVSDTLAMQFPDAEVFGLDLSPVPDRPGRTSNVHFLQGNVLNQPPSEWKAQDGGRTLFPDAEAFDLVYSRFLVAGITDWPALIQTDFRLVKSGGWVEIHEFDPMIYNAAEEPTNANKEWHTIPEAASAATAGIEYQCAQRVGPRMKEAGFVDVSVREYPLPLGGVGEKTPELQAAGDFFAETFTAIREIMIRKHADLSSDDEERLVADMRRDMAPEPGKHCKVVVAYGKKP